MTARGNTKDGRANRNGDTQTHEAESVDLFLRYMDGVTSRAEDRKVRERIRNSASERALFVQIAEQHGRLLEMAGPQLHAEDLDAMLCQKRSISSGLPRLIPWRTFLAAAAAVIVLAGGLFFSLQMMPSESGLARVERCSGDAQMIRNDIEYAVQPGMRLLHGDRLTGSDKAKLTMRFTKDRTRLTLSRSPQIRLAGRISDQHLVMKQGRIEAVIAPRPADKALVVETEHGRIQVKGTHFVAIADQGSTRVRVLEGMVGLRRFSDGQIVDVAAGHYAVANASRGRFPSGTLRDRAWIEGRVVFQETFEEDAYTWIPGILDLAQNETYIRDSATNNISYVQAVRNGAITRCLEIAGAGDGEASSIHVDGVEFPQNFSMELNLFACRPSVWSYLAFSEPKTRRTLYRHPDFARIKQQYCQNGKWLHFTIRWKRNAQGKPSDTAVVEQYFGSTLMLRQELTGSKPLAPRLTCESGRIRVDNVLVMELVTFD